MKKNLMFILVIWLLIFAMLETGVRVYDYMSQTDQDRAEFTSNPTAIFSPHPFTTYAANPTHVNHNAQGYRAEKNRIYKADPDAINIVSLGGSSTYGTRVHNQESYPYLLEKILRQSADTEKTINVINAGLGGYSTPNVIALLSGKIIHLKPKLIIFYVGFNDAWTRLMFSDFKSDYSHAQKSWVEPEFSFWRYSRFLDLIADKLGYPSAKPHIHSVAWKKMSGTPADNLRSSSADVFRSNLMSLIAISRTHGAIPVLATQATDFRHHPLPENNREWMQAMEEHTEVITQVADNMSVDLIDVRSAMNDNQDYFLDVLHMNGKGNMRRAKIIANYLLAHQLVGEKSTEAAAGKLDLIIEYMKLQHADVFVYKALKYNINMLRNAGMNIRPEDEEKIIRMFSDFENVVAIYAPIYKRLSKETLMKANEFFGSELGRKSIAAYASGKKNQQVKLSKEEYNKIRAYQASASWQEISKKRQDINREASRISNDVIRQILKGEFSIPAH